MFQRKTIAFTLFVLTTSVIVVSNAFTGPDTYKPRYPHGPTPRSNPCRPVCAESMDAAESAECAQCCRTTRHRSAWNCPTAGADAPFGDSSSSDGHGGVAAACCSGDWTADCWDRPSADNYQHSCDMCGPLRTYQPTNIGCDQTWTTASCWSDGIIPGSITTYEGAMISAPIIIPAGFNQKMLDPSDPTSFGYLNLGVGASLAFETGSFIGVPSLFYDTGVGNRSLTFLGSDLQFQVTNSFFESVDIGGIFTIALRNAVIDLGTIFLNTGFNPLYLYINSTYDPSVLGSTVPAPILSPSTALTYPHYTGVIKGSQYEAMGAPLIFNVAGDSGAVELLLSTKPVDPPSPFRGGFEVDGSNGSRIVITGQSALQNFSGVTTGGIGNDYADHDAIIGSDSYVLLQNGGAVVFGNGTVLWALNTTVGSGSDPLSIEFLSGCNITAEVMADLGSSPSGSFVVVDGSVTIEPGATLGPNRVTCSSGCESHGRGGVCQPILQNCTGLSCAGQCQCAGQSTASLYVSVYSPAGCLVETCSGVHTCLGGTLCCGPNTCSGNVTCLNRIVSSSSSGGFSGGSTGSISSTGHASNSSTGTHNGSSSSSTGHAFNSSTGTQHTNSSTGRHSGAFSSEYSSAWRSAVVLLVVIVAGALALVTP